MAFNGNLVIFAPRDGGNYFYDLHVTIPDGENDGGNPRAYYACDYDEYQDGATDWWPVLSDKAHRDIEEAAREITRAEAEEVVSDE